MLLSNLHLALALAACSVAGRAAVLKGPYVMLEDARTLSIRLELDRPEARVALRHEAGAGATVLTSRMPEFIRTPRDTFVARVTVDLGAIGRLRGYEVWHEEKRVGDYAWRSRIDGTLEGDPRLLVFGDTQGGKAVVARLGARWKDEQFDLLVGLGDLVDAGTRYESWAEEFFGPLQDVLPHWPMLVVAGNHDSYRERSMAWYDRYFARADSRRCFAVDFGSLRLVGLNNSDAHTKYGVDPIDPLTPQHVFLTDALLSRDALRRRAVVFAHVPLFSASTVVNREFGSELQRRYVLPVLERARVLGFFAGHHHKYERVLRSGLRGETQYIVSGGAGGHLFTAQRDTGGTTMDRQIFEVFHYLLVDFAGPGEIIARSIDGVEIDRTTFGTIPTPTETPPELSLWRATLDDTLSTVPGKEAGRSVTLRTDAITRATPKPASATLHLTRDGFVAVARGLAARGADRPEVTWQGYDPARRSWGYLQGAILTVPTDGPRGALALVAVNGADLAPLDRIFPVLHWPVAGSRAGVSEKSGAVLLLRGAASFDFDPDPARIIGRWQWGAAPGGSVAESQRSRQLGALGEAHVPVGGADDAWKIAWRALWEAPREVLIVRERHDGPVVATLVHWPEWHFLAVAPGASLAAGTGGLFLPTRAGGQIVAGIEAGVSGIWVRSPGLAERFVPLIRGG